MEEYNYGHIKINLEALLKERGMSKNKLAHRAEMQRIQLSWQGSALPSIVGSRTCSNLCQRKRKTERS